MRAVKRSIAVAHLDARMVREHVDRGGLASPISATIYETRAARLHPQGDGLRYAAGGLTHYENRDATELQRIVDQLPGKPVCIDHDKAQPCGEVLSARLSEDGKYAIARMALTSVGTEAIKTRGEVSLGYSVDELDPQGFQRGTQVDHLALVEHARCGPECSTARGDCDCESCSKPKADEDPADVVPVETIEIDGASETAAAAALRERMGSAWTATPKRSDKFSADLRTCTPKKSK